MWAPFNESRFANSSKEMKYIIAGIYSSFETTIVDDTGIEQSDAYTAPPKNDKLMIKLTHVESVRT